MNLIESVGIQPTDHVFEAETAADELFILVPEKEMDKMMKQGIFYNTYILLNFNLENKLLELNFLVKGQDFLNFHEENDILHFFLRNGSTQSASLDSITPLFLNLQNNRGLELVYQDKSWNCVVSVDFDFNVKRTYFFSDSLILKGNQVDPSDNKSYQLKGLNLLGKEPSFYNP